MTKQDQVDEMMLDVPQTIVAYDANPKGQHLYGEQRLQIAEVLYDKVMAMCPSTELKSNGLKKKMLIC